MGSYGICKGLLWDLQGVPMALGCLWQAFWRSGPKPSFGILLSSPWDKPANAKAKAKKLWVVGKSPTKAVSHKQYAMLHCCN